MPRTERISWLSGSSAHHAGRRRSETMGDGWERPGENMTREITKKQWAITAIVLGAAIFLSIAGMHRAFQWVPEFYTRRLDVPTLRQVRTAGMLEPLVDLNNALQTEGAWAVAISDAQINRWLANDLGKQFPRLLPGYASQPRIEIDQGTANVACQYNNGRMSAVLSMCVEAFSTDQPNVIGLRICHARIGAVPGLTGSAVEQLTWAARRSGLRLRWLQEEGDPVALVEIPQQALGTENEVAIEDIELRDGQLRLRGRTLIVERVGTKPATIRPAHSHPQPVINVSYKPRLANQ